MPTANCFISPDCEYTLDCSQDLIRLWANYSKIPHAASEMTINLILSKEQKGKKYMAMAFLVLPSIWPKDDISALQLGLSRALSEYYSISIDKVFISTSVINSGFVVENDHEITW